MEEIFYDEAHYFNRFWFEQVKEGLLTQGELIENISLNPVVKTDLKNKDRFINSNYEQTDLRLAVLYGFTDVIDYLVEVRGDDLNDLDCYGNNVFMYSFRNVSLSMSKYLLEKYLDKIDFNIVNFSDRDVLKELLSKSGSKHFVDQHYIKLHKDIKFYDQEDNNKIISLYDLYEKSKMYNIEENESLFYILDVIVEKTNHVNRTDKYGYDVILFAAMTNVRLLPYFISKGYKYDTQIKNCALFLSDRDNVITTFPKSNLESEKEFWVDFSSFIFRVEYLQPVEKHYLYNQCMKTIFLVNVK